MNDIWAPWRADYITRPKDSSCILCTAPKNGDSLILKKGRECYAIMNRFPYTAGHVLVAPYRHVGDLTALSPEETSEIMSMVKDIMAATRKAMNPAGFNVGCNIGTVAGAGIADHFHMHIVPRWNGDTNFMPVLDQTRVISEALASTYSKIKQAIP
nr:HIT domain-containing protein [Candidatus Sigynarchaeota archaeon]